MMEAQAVVAEAPGRVVFKAVAVPEPTTEDVVVRVQHSWISPGTERSYILGERLDGETPLKPTDPQPFPFIPGYQKAGVVEWVGGEVEGVEVGETVFASVSQAEGMFFARGGHISPAVTHYSQIWKLPEGRPAVAFSGLVLTQVGYNCGSRPDIAAGDAVVIIGDGLIGHWAAQTLVQRGARVMLAGKHDSRLSHFAASAQDSIVNIIRNDPVQAARAWAPQGLQAVIDTVGSVSSLESFFPLMRRDGHLVSAGFHGTAGKIDIQQLRKRELTLHAPSGWTRPRMDATLALVGQGILQTAPLITHYFPVARAAEAFELILGRREPFLGVILDWE
jgi:2-desacetyl-2-hydroxyethyl bacteriochlorophyllide A dehydrogenase